MAHTHTFQVVTNGRTMFKSTKMNDGDYQWSSSNARCKVLSGGDTVRFTDGASAFDMDVSIDIILINDDDDVLTVSYGVGGTATTNTAVALNKYLNPLFSDANSGPGGSGGSDSSIVSKADNTAAFAAISNGQSQDFEVGGIVSRYVKSSAGDKQIITYLTYP